MPKRLLDIFLSVPALLALSPLFAVLALLIMAESGRPIFFRQKRVGLQGQEFWIYKLRTMHQGAQSLGSLTMRADTRITRIGSFLRRHKLDELPQLFNVLKGDMSLVGPRPEIPEYVRAYPEQDKGLVLSVRPGLTDFAALEFRNESELLDGAQDPEQVYLQQILPRKLDLYRKYVHNASLSTDLALIFRTIKTLVYSRH